MINSLKSILSRNITNARGWKTDRKIVVFESDDWGSIRMKNQEAYMELLNKGIRVDKSKYDSIDCLESKDDLELLFNLLDSIKGNEGRKPIFTFNTVMQNPDFDRIKDCDFEKFIGENFQDSYKRYYNDDYFYLWENAINEKIMLPQFHAKEHLNAFLWLKDLRAGHVETTIAFDHSFFGLKTQTSSLNRNFYLATYYAESQDEFDYVSAGLVKGLELFEDTFGMKSETFIACNYFWPTELEKVLAENTIEGLQGQRVQLAPDLITSKLNKISHYTGQTNRYKQIFTVRNVSFEPYLNPDLDWDKKAFKEIENAFKWNTPAIISTHRINYVGKMSLTQRDKNLKHLEKLLKMLIKSHPDVIFMTSSELSDLIHNNHK